MKRRLALFFTVVFVLAVAAVPCMAAEIDFNDYITNESVSGDNTIVTVSIPLDELSIQWILWDRTNGTWPLLKDYTGLTFTHTYSSTIDYGLTINPFLTDTIDVRDIPDGTVITFSYTAEGVGYSGDSGIRARIGITYLDENGKSLGYVNGTFSNGQFLEDNAVPYTLNKPDGTVSIRPSMTFDDFKPIGNVTATISLTGVSFQFSIDSLLRLQQETGRTNKILQNIQQTFDDFINRVPVPEAPEFQEPMEDVLQSEQNILDRLPMQSVLEEFRNKESLVEDGFQANASAFSLMVLIWEKFFMCNSWYEFLCYFSLVIGCVVSFVGITLAFVSKKGGKG